MTTPTPKAPDSHSWTRRGNDSTRSWGGERETGAAFRGYSRGRGRGGSSVRGRRGAGGRSVSARGAPDVKSTPSPAPDKAGTDRDIPKASSRPNLAINSRISEDSDLLSPLSPSKTSRRRRNTNRRSVSSAVPKPIQTALTDSLPTSTSAPLMDAKDPPPNIEKSPISDVRVHDLRQDIANLVDHVRSMAMENNRPHSPTTHFDWAGEEDDSLPDLDDWGISSKLVSDVGESSTKIESKPTPIMDLSTSPASAAISEKEEVKEQGVSQLFTIDAGQSSAESPTESSMSFSVPPPVKRVRERRRGGSRREREKRKAQLNISADSAAPSTRMPKKGLLERIGSPMRPEHPSLPGPGKSGTIPSAFDQGISGSRSEPNLPLRSPLPPKPSGLPKKPPNKDLVSWRKGQPEHSRLQESNLPDTNAEATTSLAVGKRSSDGSEKSTTVLPVAERNVEATVATKNSKNSSFNWSELPVSFEAPTKPLTEPSVNIEPATPLENTALQPPASPTPTSSSLVLERTDVKSDVSASPRRRSQRPLSGDTTPRSRPRDRSPYKAHNPRNFSAPSPGRGPGSSPGGGTRPQHGSRPVLRVDALAMISRSLRDSPPPRRESPTPATKVAE